MAKINYTPVSFWLDMPLIELKAWIKDTHEMLKTKKRRR